MRLNYLDFTNNGKNTIEWLARQVARREQALCEAHPEMAKDMASYKYRGMWAEDTKDLNGVNDVDDFITVVGVLPLLYEGERCLFKGKWENNTEFGIHRTHP